MPIFPLRRSCRPARRRRPTGRGVGLEQLEQRLALAITLPITNATNLAASGYDVWVTGHGIPGWQPAGQSPQLLMSLGADGTFDQTATAIASGSKPSATATTATITTQAPHRLTNNETVFIAGTSQGGKQPSYDGTYLVTVTGPDTFTITVSPSAPQGIGLGGTVYAATLLKPAAVTSVTTLNVTPSPASGPPFATAKATTSAPHGLSNGQTIQISNVVGPSGTYNGIYNGVFTVGNVTSATTFTYNYYFGTLPVPNDAPGQSTSGGTVTSAGIQPVKASSLPSHAVTLDDSMTNISSRLYFFVGASTTPPTSISLNGINPSDPTPPPFNYATTLPDSVFDIMEFAYLPTGVTSTTSEATFTMTGPHGLTVGSQVTISGVSDANGNLIPEYNTSFTVASVPDPLKFTVQGTFSGGLQGGGGTVNGWSSPQPTISPSFSTFDVSAVDGLTIPMTLTASALRPGSKVSSVGINTAAGFTRENIGTAFTNFMTADPLGHVDATNPASRDFKKLLYDTSLSQAPITNASASWSSQDGATFTFTTPLQQPLVSGQTVVIDGFFQNGYNGTFTVNPQPAPTTTSFSVSNSATGLTSDSNGTVTPMLLQAPLKPAGQFNTIAAPKDWLANQNSSTSPPNAAANLDPLATFWTDTINNFFADGNSLSIYLGKESDAPIYTGQARNGVYTLSNKKSDGTPVNTFTFSKPTADPTTGQSVDLANALYVWSQPNPGSGDQGLLQDQIWSAMCRGVALDGVNPVTISVHSATSTGWVAPVPGVHNPLGTATITTATPHGLPINSTPNVVMSGVSNPDYNGVQAVTVTGTNTLTYTYQPNQGNPYGSIVSAVVGTYDPSTKSTPVTVTMLAGGTVPQRGDIIYLTTISVVGYNGQQVVTGASGNTFTYSLAGNQSSLAQGNGGIVWGGLYAAGTGGTVDAGGTSTAWNDTTNWYTQHTSLAFPDFQSVYCPYSKFLHYSTLSGDIDTTGQNSIFLGNAAYGFGEDENPIGNPYTGPLVPSKLDSSVADGASVEIYLVPWTASTTAPYVSSITTNPAEKGTTPTPTTASSVTWTVTFSESVTGVATTAPFANFTLVPSEGLSGTSITLVAPNGTGQYSQSWTVTASTGTGSGTLGLNLSSVGSIKDQAGNLLSGTKTGEVYSVRPTPVGPTATITLADQNPTTAATVGWNVSFTEAVSGLSASNFELIATGIAGYGPVVVAAVGTQPTKNWTVSASTGSGSGTLALKLANPTNVTPAPTGLPLTSVAYTIDKDAPTAPTVSSISLAGKSPTSASSVAWTITFSEPVTGLTAANLQLVPTGLSGSGDIQVTPASTALTATWTVTASTGNGTGTLGLNMVNSTNVQDANSQAVTNVPFTTGGVYTIDRTAPALQSITRADANPTQLPQVHWTVRFSEPVSGVNAGNFQLQASGLTGYGPITVTPTSGSSTVWTLTAASGSGTGTLQLNMANAAGITDAAQLAPTGIPLDGPAYDVQRSGASIVTAPIGFWTSAGKASPLVWSLKPFIDTDSVTLKVALSVPAGTFTATSRAGVTVIPSGSASQELQFTGTVQSLNAFFMNKRGLIRYTPQTGSLLPQTLTLSAEGSDSLSGLATAAIMVKAATAQSPKPTVSGSATLSGPAGKPLVISYDQLVTATSATQTQSRSVVFNLMGIVKGKLEYWAGSRWVRVPNVRNLPLLVPGGQLRWTPPTSGPQTTLAFKVRTTDGWSFSGISQVSVTLS